MYKNKRKNNRRRLSAPRKLHSSQPVPFLAKLRLAIKRLAPTWQACILLATAIVLVWSYAAVAQDAKPATTDKVIPILHEDAPK